MKVEDDDGGEGFLPWPLVLVAWMVLVGAADEAAAGGIEGRETRMKMRMTAMMKRLQWTNVFTQ